MPATFDRNQNTGDRRNEHQRIQDSRTCHLGRLLRRCCSGAFRVLHAALADIFAVYVKTKNFHWHISGPHFRDFHLLLDDLSEQIFATTDAIAERVRKVGGTTIRSIGHIARCQRVRDNNEADVHPIDMLEELRKDNELLVASMREAHAGARARSRTGSAKAGLASLRDDQARRIVARR
ncbi:DNA starvation/stationary phase protection protein [Bradyrhizobium sp. 170]|uniref:Dps family protein n=1 Tax=Bradyrhizobium sp. 170 TaxID=2782641 RepID=UPI001FFE3A96|nr:DNA starvation/stationary phase protection protein [Bradyrhizobium sp. 170]